MNIRCKKCGADTGIEDKGLSGRFRLPPLLCEDCRRGEQREAEARQRQAVEAARQAALAEIRADVPAALARCGVPVAYHPASFETCHDLPADLVQWARGWAERPSGFLVLAGAVGTGKTWLAVSALRHVLCEGVRPLTACRFLPERTFFGGLKADMDGRNPEAWRSLPAGSPWRVPLLVLDDLGAARVTDWTRGELAGLVEARHAAMLPTLITTNLAPEDLADAMDERARSRVAGDGQLLKLGGDDLRLRSAE